LGDIITLNHLSTWLHTTSSVLIHISEEKTMKPVKSFLLAALLVSSMTLTTYAGEIETPGNPAPPPSSQCTTVNSADEDACTPNSGSDSSGTSDNLLYEALTVFCSIF
jgi:hypothetical protein